MPEIPEHEPTDQPESVVPPLSQDQPEETGDHAAARLEIQAWQQKLAELSKRQRELDELIKQRESIEAEEASFLAAFKLRFGPAILPISPGLYGDRLAAFQESKSGQSAIIKPSRRGDIVRAGYLGLTDELFFYNERNEPRSLTEFDDYLILRERNRWQGDELRQHAQWLTDCLIEIDSQQALKQANKEEE